MRYLIVTVLFSVCHCTLAQSIPDDRVVSNQKLSGWLKEEVREQITTGDEIFRSRTSEVLPSKIFGWVFSIG